jgi:hypothetical protein
MRHDEDAPEGQDGAVRPHRICLIEQLLVLRDKLRPMIIRQRL